MAHWVRLRKRRINTDFGVSVEEWDGEAEGGFDRAGMVRLTTFPGRVWVLGPEDGAKILRAIDDQIDAATGDWQTFEVRQVRPPRADPGTGGRAPRRSKGSPGGPAGP